MKRAHPKAADEFPPLSKRQLAELARRVKDTLDPVRYVIVSPFAPNFSMCYCPSDGMFVMNEIPDLALFKRKTEALCVAQVLERRLSKPGGGLQIIQVKKTKRGVRILGHVRSDGRTWKPKLRARFRGQNQK
jgi:hypothetical protein